MAFTVQVSLPIVNRWCTGRCTGFRVHQSGTVIGYFKIIETDEDITRFMGKTTKIELNVLNELRRACGMKDIVQIDNLDLPDVGDDNMMGYNAIIEIYPTKDGKYLVAKNFRRHNDDQSEASASNQAEEDPF